MKPVARTLLLEVKDVKAVRSLSLSSGEEVR